MQELGFIDSLNKAIENKKALIEQEARSFKESDKQIIDSLYNSESDFQKRMKLEKPEKKDKKK